MDNSSVFSCEHIHVRRIAGRTDAFVAALKKYLRTLFDATEFFGTANLVLSLDEQTHTFEWMGDVNPASDENCIDAMDSASEIDVRLDICCEDGRMLNIQNALSDMLENGALKDCVSYCELLEDAHTSSLYLSGPYRGSFLHGSVPFTGCDDILVDNTWNGYTHRAEFVLHFEAEDEVRDIADELGENLEIDIELMHGAHELTVASVQLVGPAEVELYRSSLEKLVRIADSSKITGALTPESDTLFALLRFVKDGSSVDIQTAVAES